MLELPAVKRDDIAHSLSEIHLPGVGLPRLHLSEAVSKFEWPTIDLSSVDVGNAVTAAAQAAHLRRRAQRPRWPLAVGALVLAGLASCVVLSNGPLRARLARGAATIRERISGLRSDRNDLLEFGHDHPVAFSAAETQPIQASPFADRTTSEASGYPAGLGSNNGHVIPAFEKSGTPA